MSKDMRVNGETIRSDKELTREDGISVKIPDEFEKERDARREAAAREAVAKKADRNNDDAIDN